MEPSLIAWLLIVVAPLGLAWGAAVAWRETDKRTISRVRNLVQLARAKSEASRREMQALLQDASVKLESQANEVQNLRDAVDAQSPALRAAIERAPRQSHDEIASHIDGWFSRDEVERRARRMDFAKRVERIEATWFESTATENKCSELLSENLWLLEPDLVSIGHVFRDRSLENIARAYFPGDRTTVDPKFLNPEKRADIAGVFYRNDMMTTGALQPERVFVVIEAKAVHKEITPFHMDEAFQYALNLRKMVPSLADWNIECYALGGSIADGVHRQHFRVGPGPQAITVTPITWNFLLQRAKALDPARIVARKIDVNGANPPSFLGGGSQAAQPTE
jgi:hypothetical protein